MNLTRRTALRLLAAGAAVPSLGRLGFGEPAQAGSKPESNAPYKQADLPVEDRVRDLVKRMTVQEKARQLDMYAGFIRPVQSLVENDARFLRDNASHLRAPAPKNEQAVTDIQAHVDAAKKKGFRPEDAHELWGDLGVGSIHELDPTPELANTIQHWVIENSRLGIPVLFLEEGLHGYFDGTIFPSPIGLAATWNPEIARRTGAAIAAEARANGVGMILTPVLDVARDPRWGRVEEDFGEDPYLTGQMGLAFVRGEQGDSLRSDHTAVAGLKHFVAYGSPESGTNTSPVHIGERELRTTMLKPFEPAIREGNALAIMAAYPEIDGLPITANPGLLIDILRGELGFRGFVLTDLGAIRHLYDRHFVVATPEEAICLAINSGVDMQFYDFDHETFQNAICTGIRNGMLSPIALDRAVSSILRVKFELGLFDRPAVNPKLDARVRRSRAHLDLSLQSARESMTLLKNENHLLPLSKSLKSIAVIGPNANVARYGDYSDPTKGARISMLTGIKAIVPGATIVFDEGKDVSAAVEKAKNAEVAILGLGGRLGISGEGFDRSNLGLPDDQQKLLEAVTATGKPIVLVLQNGRPLALDWAAKHIPAIIEAWYPAEFGGTAIAETLFGDNNPGGHLTISFPQTVGQLPDYYNYEPSKKLAYIDCNGKPLFPFGFGLSYTTFEYNHLSVRPPVKGSHDDVVITVDVSNTGHLSGDEVAQLYFRDVVASVETPIRSLGGFSRIHLAPHETRSVTFHLEQRQLAVWDRHKKWIVEPGEFIVWVGGSSEATLSSRFSLS